jgi:hypothetical protein
MLPYIMAHLMMPKKDVWKKMKIQKRGLTHYRVVAKATNR